MVMDTETSTKISNTNRMKVINSGNMIRLVLIYKNIEVVSTW